MSSFTGKNVKLNNALINISPKSYLKKLYKKFTPYCSVATWYLWRSIDDEPIQY